jgi:hypothetical protein
MMTMSRSARLQGELTMHDVREPRIHPVAILDLRPTQITVGMREVAAKRKRWIEQGDEKQADFLGSHLLPVVAGPKEKFYVVDHHHLALALHDAGQTTAAITVIADLRSLDRDSFWFFMDNRGWMHPFDAAGKRCGYDALPKSVTGLVDDPYRSLAGELRLAGGFAKDTTPFSEFLWADYLRRRVKRKRIADDFDGALAEALSLARSAEANYMPGWCGPLNGR